MSEYILGFVKFHSDKGDKIEHFSDFIAERELGFEKLTQYRDSNDPRTLLLESGFPSSLVQNVSEENYFYISDGPGTNAAGWLLEGRDIAPEVDDLPFPLTANGRMDFLTQLFLDAFQRFDIEMLVIAFACDNVMDGVVEVDINDFRELIGDYKGPTNMIYVISKD